MTRWLLLGVSAVLAVGCTEGELGNATTDEDAAIATGDALDPSDSTFDGAGDSVVDSTVGPLPDTAGIDVPAVPYDGAPADFGTGGCTFSGSSLAAALTTTIVAGATPSGEAPILAERPGGLVVAWASGAGWRVTPLDATGARAGSDIAIDGLKVYGVAAGADGFAVLVSRAPDYMTLLRTDASGAVVNTKNLVGGGNHATVGTEWFGEFANTGRLVATPTGFAAYFGIHRRWPDMIGHQGDTLRLFDGSGNPAGVNWDWGCSHSLDQRLAYGTRIGGLCVSDCYPQKAVMLNHNQTMVSSEPSGNCSGGSSARLGGIAGDATGFVAAVLSKEGRTSLDVKVVKVGTDSKVSATTWLSTTPEDETSLHLARFGGAWLAGWQNGGNKLQRVDGAGAAAGALETITAPWPGHDFVSLASGDTAWAANDAGKLTIVRVRCL